MGREGFDQFVMLNIHCCTNARQSSFRGWMNEPTSGFFVCKGNFIPGQYIYPSSQKWLLSLWLAHLRAPRSIYHLRTELCVHIKVHWTTKSLPSILISPFLPAQEHLKPDIKSLSSHWASSHSTSLFWNNVFFFIINLHQSLIAVRLCLGVPPCLIYVYVCTTYFSSS